MNYQVKKYERKYLYSCAELVRETWDFHSSFEGLTDVMPIYLAYVRDCLDYSVYLKIVVDQNDKVQGLIFGSLEHSDIQERLRIIRNRLKTNYWVTQNWFFGRFGKRQKALRNFKAQSGMDEAGEQYAKLFGGEVNLFIVSEELRGQKLGYLLMNGYVEFCKEHEVETIFLWTELGCTYSFYERYGFMKHSTFYNENLTATEKNQDNGFIYYYSLQPKDQVETTIKLKPIDSTNQEEVLSLGVFENQRGMVESVAACLEEAQTSSYGVDWTTTAICLNQTAVGFAMYGLWQDPNGEAEDEVWLDRFLIDRNYQGQGYGKQALGQLITLLSKKYQSDEIYLSVYKQNRHAITLYKGFGFKFNGEREQKGEYVMVLKIE